MFRKRLLFSALIAGTSAAASVYNVTLNDSVSAAGTQLTAGNYKVEIQTGKAIFKAGKKTFEVPAALQTGDRKYTSTSAIVIAGAKLKEIDLGGTKNKIVFQTE
ncbi:MAG TPA: hypothetical protein VG273_25755 [Bryobacteraceae bacterium]|jgi:hypothetical protein|nr:hypothetical protein [Bryobacteraceae bacterium]